MDVSIIIPTYNRSSTLSALLRNLTRQEQPPSFEVIVCDDGSTDHTAKVCASFQNSLALSYFFQEDRGFRASKARNIGIEHAKGDVLIFLDDDCLPSPNFIAAHWRQQVKEEMVIGLGSRVRIRRLTADGAPLEQIEIVEGDNRQAWFDAGIRNHPAPWMLTYSCNFSVPRGHPEAYFDERYTGWGMEDTDIGYRLWRAGAVYRVVDGGTVLHEEDMMPRDPFRRESLGLEPDYRTYLENCVRLLDKFPEDEGLWSVIIEDLSWYVHDEARGIWKKDGGRHDPHALLDTIRRDINSSATKSPLMHTPTSQPAAGMRASNITEWAVNRELEEIAIELTGYCNLSCVMCSVWQIKQNGPPYDAVIRMLDDARRLGARRLTPCGAENFMRRDFIDILEYAESIGFEEINVVTNGTLFSTQKLDRLQSLASLHFNISLDGPRPVHDQLRGAGAFDRTVHHFRELTRRGLSFGLSSVLMAQTIDHIEGVIDLACEFGIKTISLQPYQEEIGGPQSDHRRFGFLHSSEEKIRRRLEEIVDYSRRRGIEVYTENLLLHVPVYLARGVRPIPAGGCFIPSRFLLVDYRGDVYPCFFMRDRRIGNIFDESITQLWHNEIQRELNILALKEQCPGCLAACSDVETYNIISSKGARHE